LTIGFDMKDVKSLYDVSVRRYWKLIEESIELSNEFDEITYE
jgi:hypothetical protein